MKEIIGTDEFAAWFAALAESAAESVTRAVSLLEALGHEQPRIAKLDRRGWPGMDNDLPLYEMAIEDSALRVLFALEDSEEAILLYGYNAAVESPSNVERPVLRPIRFRRDHRDHLCQDLLRRLRVG